MFKKLKKDRQEKKYKKQIGNGLFLFMRIDQLMETQKWSSQRRKQFWHDFIKSPKYRLTACRAIFESLQDKAQEKTT